MCFSLEACLHKRNDGSCLWLPLLSQPDHAKCYFQDVIHHGKNLKREKQDMSTALQRTKGIKSLSKESHEKLEAYQNLFYLLQTNPVYLAKLIFAMPQSKFTKFMESVILTLYNYASNAREEYLLVKLFDTALKEEIK